jgi:hypothetical protein
MRSSPHKFHKSISFDTPPHAEEVAEDDEDSVRDNYSVKVQHRLTIDVEQKGWQSTETTPVIKLDALDNRGKPPVVASGVKSAGRASPR